jgi:hypothetical protein
MNKIKFSSKDLLQTIFDPFIKLAINSFDSIDPSENDNISSGKSMLAITALLAGIEKVLNVTFQLLYISRKVDWKWLVKNQDVAVGTIQCNRGLSAKLRKLEELGIRKNDLQWMVDLRNDFIHLSNLQIGYKIGMVSDNPPKLELKARYPEITFNFLSIIKIPSEIINSSSMKLISSIADYLDRAEWQDAWIRINRSIDKLPLNPEPEYTKALASRPEEIFLLINDLNMRYIGTGLEKLDY